MANSKPNTNGRQFFRTGAPTPWLDRTHVVSGMATSGMKLAMVVEAVRTQRGALAAKVVLIHCGELYTRSHSF
jgi:cyclophilin family peptidyl-prolyl cis-trans isomerase